MRYLLYNPVSGKENQAYANAICYSAAVSCSTEIVDVTKIEDLRDFFSGMDVNDDTVVFGGDGTLNRIINSLSGYHVKNDIYYFPCGTGNDFARDIGIEGGDATVLLNGYMDSLPTVTVNGMKKKFINGVGFGIDGYCCEMGDLLKSKGKNANYAAIAVKGLLFHFKPVNATVTVDGQSKRFENVWLAPTMFGRYYGGGMIPTPGQDRNAEDKKVSLMIFRGKSKLRVLTVFPSIFKGEHLKQKNNVTVFQGKRITVEFDSPSTLQIDGETVSNVKSYTVEV